MTPNIPLLRKAVEWVEEQDQLTFAQGRVWEQGLWCGTAFCVAGKVALDDGWTLMPGDTARLQRDGRVEWVDDIATRLLGISESESEELFSGSNKAADIRRIAEEIAGERL